MKSATLDPWFWMVFQSLQHSENSIHKCKKNDTYLLIKCGFSQLNNPRKNLRVKGKFCLKHKKIIGFDLSGILLNIYLLIKCFTVFSQVRKAVLIFFKFILPLIFMFIISPILFIPNMHPKMASHWVFFLVYYWMFHFQNLAISY